MTSKPISTEGCRRTARTCESPHATDTLLRHVGWLAPHDRKRSVNALIGG